MSASKSLWESEQNYFDAFDYFENLRRDIEASTNSIYLESYIFEVDIVGLKIINALTEAKLRGVDIKVLVDGIGSMNSLPQLIEQFEKSSIFLKIYRPLPWSFKSYRYALNKGAFFEKLLHFTGHINHRDHRKLCVIDKQIAWTGSYNLIRTHLKLEEGGEGWKDHGVRVTGKNVEFLSNEFLQIWHRRSHKTLKKSLPSILSTLNPLKRKRKLDKIIQSIDNAKKRIWISNAYFAPHRSITTALRHAELRGVEVRIIVGSKSDIIFFPSLTRSFYSDLLSSRIEVFEWQEGILHSKIVLLDDYCYSGSSNLNSRSHSLDLELDILVCLEPTIKEIEQQFISDFNCSKKIEFSYLNDNSFYIFIMSFIPKLLRYWL